MTFQEELVGIMERMITRRQFLTKLSMAVLGAAVTWIGGQGVQVHAAGYCNGSYPYACCTLCCPAGARLNLPGCVSKHSYQTKWCWFCDYGGRTYKCCEAKDINAECSRSCDRVFASWYERTGYAPDLS